MWHPPRGHPWFRKLSETLFFVIPKSPFYFVITEVSNSIIVENLSNCPSHRLFFLLLTQGYVYQWETETERQRRRERERDRERHRERERKRNIGMREKHWSVAFCKRPPPRIKLTTYACVLTRNQTCSLLVHGVMFQSTELPGQGSEALNYLTYIVQIKPRAL